MDINKFVEKDIQRNIDLFSQLLQCGSNVYLWKYSPSGELISSNCPHFALSQIFVRSLCKDKLIEHAAVSRLPVTLSAVLGFIWGAAFEYNEDELKHIYVIGPVLGAQYEQSEAMKAFSCIEIPGDYKNKLLNLLMEIPTIPAAQFMRLVLMLHCCVTGQKLGRKDIVPIFTENEQSENTLEDSLRNRSRVYMAEQALLNNVREGNRNYRRDLEVAGQVSSGVGIRSGVATDQSRISVIVFSSLCTRAAIDGGLSPETAYAVGDKYIQEANNAKSITNLQNIADRMYDDFISRVHRLKEINGISPQIRICLELMEENPEESISLADLAARVNYSEYYLSRVFKKETGMSVSEYSHKVRINRAKTLLLATSLPVYDIASKLHYSSSSHFSDRFYRLTGMYPQEYRDSNTK